MIDNIEQKSLRRCWMKLRTRHDEIADLVPAFAMEIKLAEDFLLALEKLLDSPKSIESHLRRACDVIRKERELYPMEELLAMQARYRMKGE